MALGTSRWQLKIERYAKYVCIPRGLAMTAFGAKLPTWHVCSISAHA
jgi:hypothetical protein